ncbi:MAG: recombinase family protein [Sedimentibacter sp.]
MADNKIIAYMRISTTKATQKTDRQELALNEYARNNNFTIAEWYSDTITGGTKAENRPQYNELKKQLRKGDTLLICDIDRLGRNADDVIRELKQLKADGIRVIALDVPYMNDWIKTADDSMYSMIIDILTTLKAHMAQQEKEKTINRINQGLDVARANGVKLGRPEGEIPKEFIKEYKKFKNGDYGKISATQFAKLQGIARSTLYKYINQIDNI